MTAFETTSRVGADGKLHLSVPGEFANKEVRVTVEPTATTNGVLPPGTRPAVGSMTPAEWRDFVERTAGSIPDFPDVERPGPDSYEDRGEWA